MFVVPKTLNSETYSMCTQDFRGEMLPQWETLLRKLFPIALPNSVSWNRLDDIFAILQELVTTADICHMLLPSSGGIDIDRVARSPDSRCIDIIDHGHIHTMVPKLLTCEIFKDSLEHSYFRLECSSLAPEGDTESPNIKDEELVRLRDGTYTSRIGWDDGVTYDEHGYEIELPKGAKLATRYMGGIFVFVCKASKFGQSGEAYDGLQNTMSAAEFRDHIRLHWI
ncbi:hypothetical protein [Novipirellula aureliae]|nr:hypothetical protein [Novipirellula aureliae]